MVGLKREAMNTVPFSQGRGWLPGCEAGKPARPKDQWVRSYVGGRCLQVGYSLRSSHGGSVVLIERAPTPIATKPMNIATAAIITQMENTLPSLMLLTPRLPKNPNSEIEDLTERFRLSFAIKNGAAGRR